MGHRLETSYLLRSLTSTRPEVQFEVPEINVEKVL